MMAGQQFQSLLVVAEPQMPGGDVAGHVGGVGVRGPITVHRVDITQIERGGGIPVEATLIAIVQGGQGLLASDAGRQAPGVAALDEFGGVRGEIDSQIRLIRGQDVGLAHQDHCLHLGAGHPQVQKRLMRQRLGSSVIAEVLSDPAGHLGDGACRLGDRALEPAGRGLDQGFDGVRSRSTKGRACCGPKACSA